MSFITNYISAKVRDIQEGAVKLVAKWDPESVGEAQLAEWDATAKEMAATAAKAGQDAKAARDAVTNIRSNIDRYTAAAEKLVAAGNEDAANKAADQALDWQGRLEQAVAEAQDAELWAKETLAAAQNAQRLVMEGKTKIEQAKRDQARAMQEAKIAEQRRADRERMAGLSKGISGADAAINAMSANAAAARQKAAADNIRSGVLGQAVEADAAINAALAEVDGGPKPTSLQDKLAALKGKK
jgi:hypothetical protein